MSSILHPVNVADDSDASSEILGHQKLLINLLGERGGRFVEAYGGSRLPVREGWNRPENTLGPEEAVAWLESGGNVAIACGSGDPGLYVLDMDDQVERVEQSPLLAGAITTYRENAPHKGKILFRCADPLPTRDRGSSHGVELKGVSAEGRHAKAIIAGTNTKEETVSIRWRGNRIPLLTKEQVANQWRQWTGQELFPTPRVSGWKQTEYGSSDLEKTAEALTYIGPWGIDYTTWVGFIAAIHDAFAETEFEDEALAITEDWAEGEEGEVEAKWHSFDREYSGTPTTLGSIFYYARQCGWQGDLPKCERLSEEEEALLTDLESWLMTPAAEGYLRSVGIRNVPDHAKTLAALCRVARQTGTLTPSIAVYDLVVEVDGKTTWRRLQRLAEKGLIGREVYRSGSCHRTRYDLRLLLNQVDQSAIRISNETYIDEDSSSGISHGTLINLEFVADHVTDDVFRSYAYTTALRRRSVPTVLMKPLGSSGLLLLTALEKTGGSLKELAAITGRTVAAVRYQMRAFRQNSLVIATRGPRGVLSYSLCPNVLTRLEEVRPEVTSAGLGQLHFARNALARAASAQRILQGRMPLTEHQRERLTERRDLADRNAATSFAGLAERGICPYRLPAPQSLVQVMEGLNELSLDELVRLDQASDPQRRLSRNRLHFDAGEAWETTYRHIWSGYESLFGMSKSSRYQYLVAERIAKVERASGRRLEDDERKRIATDFEQRIDLAISLSYRVFKRSRENLGYRREPGGGIVLNLRRGHSAMREAA